MNFGTSSPLCDSMRVTRKSVNLLVGIGFEIQFTMILRYVVYDAIYSNVRSRSLYRRWKIRLNGHSALLTSITFTNLSLERLRVANFSYAHGQQCKQMYIRLSLSVARSSQHV